MLKTGRLSREDVVYGQEKRSSSLFLRVLVEDGDG